MIEIAPVTGFDAPACARRLKAAGADEAQAEAHAEAVRGAIAEGVVAKAAVAGLETRTAEPKVALAGVIELLPQGRPP